MAPSMVAGPEMRRRAVYGYGDRKSLPVLFRTFGFANPDMHTPMRHMTTVPHQALFMMNSDFMARPPQEIASRPDIKHTQEGIASGRSIDED